MEKSNLNTTLQQAQAALKKYWYVPGLLILLAVLFLAGSWYGKTVAEQKCCRGPPHLALCGSHESGPHVSGAGVGSLWHEDGAGLRR